MIASILAILGLILGIVFAITVFYAPDWAGLTYFFAAFGIVSVAAAITVAMTSADVSGIIKVITTLNLVVFVGFFAFLVGFHEATGKTMPE